MGSYDGRSHAHAVPDEFLLSSVVVNSLDHQPNPDKNPELQSPSIKTKASY